MMKLILTLLWLFFLVALNAGTAEKSAVESSQTPKEAFSPDEHTILLLHADMGNEDKDASKTASHVSKFSGNVELCRGKFKQAYKFDDWKCRIEIAHKPEFSLEGVSELTIEYWMKLTKMPRFCFSAHIVNKTNTLSSYLSYNQRGSFLSASLVNKDRLEQKKKYYNEYLEITYPPKDFDYSQWHHYAFVFIARKEKKVGSMKLFIDGKQVTSKKCYTKKFNTSDAILLIGNSQNSASHRGTRPFTGALDEIRISTIARYKTDDTKK